MRNSVLDTHAIIGDARAVRYPGGKGGEGTFQTIINQMPPHRVYIEAFVGGGAVMRMKQPAQLNIGLDLSREAVRNIDLVLSPKKARGPDKSGAAARARNGYCSTPKTARFDRPAPKIAMGAEFKFIVADALTWLRSYPWVGDELVYCDPPYVMSTRTGRVMYGDFEMTDEQHAELIDVLKGLPCKVMLSGYPSRLYGQRLRSWRTVTFQAITRGGWMATERLWMNYDEPVALHDYTYLGEGWRDRDRIRKRKRRWVNRLGLMNRLERQALLAAIREAGF